ncbi:MAG: AsmA family protein, partial [Alphaproteobacteria bacterium]
MRVSTILKIIGVLVVAVVVAIVAILLTVDPNDYKEDLQKLAKDATGRDLTIGGDISLELGLTVGLAIDDVRFSNAEWGSKPDMVSAKEVAARLAILPLISGKLDIEGLTIRDAAILIETDAQGRSNFEFTPSGEAGGTPAAKDSRAESGSSEDGDVSIAINNVIIENATVTVRDAQQKSETVVVVSKLNASGSGATAPLDIELVAELTTDGNKVPVELKGTVGAPATLMSGDRPFPIDVTGKALGFDFSAKGSINEPTAMSGIAVALEASATDLSGLAPFAGDGLPAAGPFSFKGSVTGGGDAYAIEGFGLKLGNTDIGCNVKATLSGARPRIDGTITAA